MEGNLVNLNIDESGYGISPEEAIPIIENFFKTKMTGFELIDKYNSPNGYYGLKYSSKNTTVFVGSGRGYLESYISIDGDEISLKDYDNKTKLIKTANEKNICYTLEFIKNFLD